MESRNDSLSHAFHALCLCYLFSGDFCEQEPEKSCLGRHTKGRLRIYYNPNVLRGCNELHQLLCYKVPSTDYNRSCQQHVTSYHGSACLHHFERETQKIRDRNDSADCRLRALSRSRSKKSNLRSALDKKSNQLLDVHRPFHKSMSDSLWLDLNA